MKFRYVFAITMIMLCMCIFIGLDAKRTYLDLNKQKNPLDQFMIGLLSEELVDVELDMMKHDMPLENSKYILAVDCEGDTIFRYNNLSQPVKIRKIFKGEGIHVGDEIEILRNGSCLYLDDNIVPDCPGITINLNFVNEMEVNKTYLVFLENKVKGKDIFVDSKDYFLAPCFCYDTIENIPISSISQEGNFARYTDVSKNEFFCSSQSAVQKLVAYKSSLIRKYCLKNSHE